MNVLKIEIDYFSIPLYYRLIVIKNNQAVTVRVPAVGLSRYLGHELGIDLEKVKSAIFQNKEKILRLIDRYIIR
ncbi:MAG TPA: hypothetical protein PKX38_06110 [Alphaproteobacteria bacterium]|nr:hypothetical protein [Micavibrio sp.]HQX27493.1 hypothetical protein [Alphaproteobacteria bacterium]